MSFWSRLPDSSCPSVGGMIDITTVFGHENILQHRRVHRIGAGRRWHGSSTLADDALPAAGGSMLHAGLGPDVPLDDTQPCLWPIPARLPASQGRYAARQDSCHKPDVGVLTLYDVPVAGPMVANWHHRSWCQPVSDLPAQDHSWRTPKRNSAHR